MGSTGNQNPLSPYENYRDCSLGICSIYCPQFCYLIFPPPPPSDDSSSTGTTFSPLIIAVIGLLSTALLLVSYYTIVTKFCKRRRRNEAHQHRSRDSTEIEENREEWPVGPAGGMDDSLIEKITVCEYKKGDGLIEGTECAVCLSEFREEESLRLLPKCSHAFHLPCIDTWLKSQSNCPLCRANVAVSACEVSRPEDLVLEIVEDREMEHTVVISGGDDEEEGRDDEEASSDREGVHQVRRSVSLDTFPFPSSGRQLLVSDILKFEEIDEYVRVEIDQLWRGIGSSEGDGGRGKDGKLLRSPVAMKRSISTGRFTGQVAG